MRSILFVHLLFVLSTLGSSASGDVVLQFSDSEDGMRMTADGSFSTIGTQISVETFSDFESSAIAKAFSLIQAGTSGSVLTATLLVETVTPHGDFFVFDEASVMGDNAGTFLAFFSPFVSFEVPAGFQPGDIISPRPDVIFPEFTVDEVFGEAFADGPVTISTFENGERLAFVELVAIPEPSSGIFFALMCFSSLGFASRRKRQACFGELKRGSIQCYLGIDKFSRR